MLWRCCRRVAGRGAPAGARAAEGPAAAQDPWLVMQKIDSPTKMRYVGNRVAACNASDPAAVPKSIADFIKLPGADSLCALRALSLFGVLEWLPVLCYASACGRGSLAYGLHELKACLCHKSCHHGVPAQKTSSQPLHPFPCLLTTTYLVRLLFIVPCQRGL